MFLAGFWPGSTRIRRSLNSWVFKGGTCLKKCYFETYRFSEDLDFTLRDESHLDDGFLKQTLGEVSHGLPNNPALPCPPTNLDSIFIRIRAGARHVRERSPTGGLSRRGAAAGQRSSSI